jgi:hypothetical protein
LQFPIEPKTENLFTSFFLPPKSEKLVGSTLVCWGWMSINKKNSVADAKNIKKAQKNEKKQKKKAKKEARSKNISLMGKCEKGKPTSLCVGVRREEKEKKL